MKDKMTTENNVGFVSRCKIQKDLIFGLLSIQKRKKKSGIDLSKMMRYPGITTSKIHFRTSSSITAKIQKIFIKTEKQSPKCKGAFMKTKISCSHFTFSGTSPTAQGELR